MTRHLGTMRMSAHSQVPAMIRPLRIAIAFAVLTALAGCGRGGGEQPKGAVEVGVTTLVSQPVALTAELAGRTTPYAVSEVRPQVSGIIRRRSFTEGAYVTAGQVLYQIDAATYIAAVEEAAAALQSAEATVISSRLKSERYEKLAATRGVSQQEADDAKAAYGQALASVAQAKAQLQSAKINLGYTRVTAPISGRIGRSSVTEGALVTASQTDALASIQRLDPIYVDISQASADMLRLRRQLSKGGVEARTASVKLILSDGSEYDQPGTLQFAEQTVDANTGTVTLRAIFPNSAGLLLPGMYVRAVVTEAVQQNGVLAPQQGISRNARGQATALVVKADGIVEERTVVTVQAVGDKWLVSSGLNAGDRLIVEGSQKARVGEKVRAVKAGSTSAQAKTAPNAKR